MQPGLQARRQNYAADDIGDQVRASLALSFKNGPPTIGVLAAELGISVRTLQRRLTESGNSFTALLDERRRAEALQFLAAEGGPIADLAQRLGYSGQSALTRAVHRWTGKSPRRWRASIGGKRQVR
ncbi:AraC family transcriptional regulator [uncultured Jannaschia sp.]|uniref:helix-turn-helix domain-containing protein n=1 Tax=uncultured Jannaschia sp. TaxID=293347 RepID=UPI0034365D7D